MRRILTAMAEDRVDREAILARRALLVGSTLAALSCSSPGKPRADGSVETADVPPPGSAASAAGSAIAPPPEPSSWESVMMKAPPLEPPPASAAISENERKVLTEQASNMRAAYAELGKVWDQGPPDCAPSSCEERWQESTKKIFGILEGRRGPLCGWGAGEPISFIERFDAHQQFLREQAEVLKKRFAEAAERSGQEREWRRLQVGGMIPQPCLSCVAPSPRVFEQVVFAEGAAEPESGSHTIADLLATTFNANPGLRLAIRGHADPGEPGDKLALSRQRAEAVAALLVKKGIPASRFVVVPLGDAIPIESPRGDRRAANRRVDFETAP
jgi:outer membrane protein OmpA-like peptidoglycan-associated protein